jgi:glycosyltransferase involved in cell wall biosynthesis
MRIGFFTDSYLPATHGVEISIETFREELEKMGHEVFVYAPEAPGYKDKNPNVFRFKSVKIIKNPEMYNAFNFLPVNHEFKDISHLKLDIAHAHSPFSLGILAKYISERQIIPLVYTHHTHYPEYVKAYVGEKVLLPYLAKIYSTWFVNNSDAVIAPSLKIKKLLKSYGADEDIPIYVLPTGIDLNTFKKSTIDKEKLRKELDLPVDKKILLFVGRIGKEKNVEFLIEAFNELLKERKDVLLLIVGDGPFLEELKKISQEMKIESFVEFTGRVSHEKVISYYQSADVFLFPSLTDTQGIVILEALGCGTPVVVLKDDAFDGIVLDNKNGFSVKEESPSLFAQKTNLILSDSSLYNKFSDFAVKTTKNFSKEKVAEKLAGIYEENIKKYYQRK